MSPIVSIVIPVFNRKQFVEEMILSVIAQTYQQWELLLIDDGSTDGVIELMNEFAQKEERIKVIKRERLPKGAPTCRNIGLHEAIGEYIVFFDSDDLLLDTCIQQRVDCLLNNKDIDFAVFPATAFNNSGFISYLAGVRLKEDVLLSILRGEYAFLAVTNIYRKQKLLENDILWDENMIFLQDEDFNFQVISKEMKCFYPKNVQIDYFVRLHENSISSIQKSKQHLNTIFYYLKKIMIWIQSEKNIRKFKKKDIYGMVTSKYSLIKQNKDLFDEYFKF
jgi:glycosyltransferase involved in cell wall biosynthesis